MAFSIESRPNPLALLGQAAGDASLNIGRQNRQETILNNALGLLNNVDDDPMSFLGSISRLSQENQKLALGALDLQREKQAKAKDQAQAQQLAQAHGITHVPGMGSKDVLELVKQKEKYLQEANLKGLTDQKEQQRAQEVANYLGIKAPPGSTVSDVFGIARATKPPKVSLSEKPMDAEQLAAIQKVSENPDYDKWDGEKLYNELLDNDVSPVNARRAADLRNEKNKLKQGDFEKEREYNRKRSEPVLKKADEVRENIPKRRVAANALENAILSGKVGSITDYLADVSGFEPLRSNEGAIFKTASKEYFLNNIKRAGARPNMWIEQQIASAQPTFGRSPEANLTSLEMMKFEDDLDAKRIEIMDNLDEYYNKTLGYTPGNIDYLANKEMKPYVEQRQKELALKLRKTHEHYRGYDYMRKIKKVPEGTPLTQAMALILIEKYPQASNEDLEKIAKNMGFDLGISE